MRPQCITARRVRVVWRGIEKQIGVNVSFEMLIVRELGREDEACWINPMGTGRALQIVDGAIVIVIKPQYAIRDSRQHDHPGIEDLQCDFVTAVEAAEHESICRLSVLVSSGRG